MHQRLLSHLLLICALFMLLLPTRVFAYAPPVDEPYSIEVELFGGTGRASVESPTSIVLKDGEYTATITWSSPYYEFMVLDGYTYYPVNAEGNSRFEIPVNLDEDLHISAQTIAMSQPHLIEYVLLFDSATMKPLSDRPDINLWLPALIFLVIASIALLLIKKHRIRASQDEMAGK